MLNRANVMTNVMQCKKRSEINCCFASIYQLIDIKKIEFMREQATKLVPEAVHYLNILYHQKEMIAGRKQIEKAKKKKN